MKKKILSVLLASVLALSMAACGSTPSEGGNAGNAGNDTQQGGGEANNGDDANGDNAGGGSSIALDGTYPAETIKIGFVGYDNTSEQQMAIQAYYDYLSEHYNIEVMYSENLTDAEGELNFIADCAAAGCKAIIGYYNEALSEAAKTAANYEMYYWGRFGGNDEEAEKAKAECGEYYLGAGGVAGAANYEGGRSMALALAEQGCHKIVYCSGGASFGVTQFVDRKEGFLAGVEEANANGAEMEIVKEVEGWPGTDAFTADQTAVMGMDIDAIASSFDVAMWFQPVMEAGKGESLKLAAIGEVSDTYHDFFNTGLVSVIVYDNEEVCWGNAIPMVINAVTGNKLVDAEGNPIDFEVPRWTVTTPEEFNAIYDLHEAGNWVISAEDMANLIVDMNPEANGESVMNYYGSFDIDTVLQ